MKLKILVLLAVAALCGCRGTARRSPVVAPPTQYTFRVVNAFPHAVDSYTQGLYWHDGYLWEGTGQYGESALKKVELETGEILRSIALPDEVFGEGIAFLDGRIFQLTWLDGVAYVYDGQTLERVGQFRYSGEGWGLTTDGHSLFMSDGSSRIFVIDPDDFKRTRRIEVKMEGRSLRGLNELEWIDGRIWANVYMTDKIVMIDPQTGNVEGVADLSGLLPLADRTSATDVLNGIAFDSATGRIFVTGKYWSKLFEIELVAK